MSEPTTFVEACLAGKALASDVDDWVDTWHDAPESSEIGRLSLAEYLGMSSDEYSLWVERPESLRFIVAGRGAHIPARSVELIGGLAGAAARSEHDAEAAGVVQWLKDTGRL